jgi:carboxylesterase type B
VCAQVRDGCVSVLLRIEHHACFHLLLPVNVRGLLIVSHALPMSRALAGVEARAVRARLAKQGGSIYDRCDRIYTDAVFAEPVLATARRLLTSQHRFYCYRFDRVSPGAEESNFLAKHTAELRYLFGTLTADG